VTARVQSQLASSVLFILASLLTGIMSFLALGYVFAKAEASKHSRSQEKAFLADKQRALSFYWIFSTAYDLLNPYLYTGAMRKEIVNMIDSDGCLRVLDVGCGTGYTTAGILNRSNVCEVVGVDMNPKQLAKATRNLRSEKTRATLSRGDVDNLPFQDEAFDAVVSVGAIEYFPDPQTALKEMARVTKQGGRVIVGGPELGWFRKVALDRFFYTPSVSEMDAFFKKAELKAAGSVLIGVDTFMDTGKYVVVTSGLK
jgi:ubiquinone/menaquinone biosynthesis C-methylase UbiE